MNDVRVNPSGGLVAAAEAGNYARYGRAFLYFIQAR